MDCTLPEYLIRKSNSVLKHKKNQSFVFPYIKVWKANVYNRQDMQYSWQTKKAP